MDVLLKDVYCVLLTGCLLFVGIWCFAVFTGMLVKKNKLYQRIEGQDLNVLFPEMGHDSRQERR